MKRVLFLCEIKINCNNIYIPVYCDISNQRVWSNFSFFLQTNFHFQYKNVSYYSHDPHVTKKCLPVIWNKLKVKIQFEKEEKSWWNIGFLQIFLWKLIKNACVNFQFSGIYCYSHVFRDNLALKEWINLSNRGSWVCAYRLQLVPPFQQSLLLGLKKGKKKNDCRILRVQNSGSKAH